MNDSLLSRLNYGPEVLKFGTSGRRGLVRDLSQLEIYINVLGELRYLQTVEANQGGIRPGESFYVATDLRPSSTQLVPEQGGRGALAQAVLKAVADACMKPFFFRCNFDSGADQLCAGAALRQHHGDRKPYPV